MNRHLIHILSSNSWRSEVKHAFDICRHYNCGGWDVAVFTRDARVVDDPFRREGIRLHHAPLSGFTDMESAISIAKVVRSLPSGPVVVHAHSLEDSFTALAAKWLSHRDGIKVVMTRHYPCRVICNWISQKIYAGLDSMVFFSETSRREFLSAWKGKRLPFGEVKTHVVRNSIFPDWNCGFDVAGKHPVCAMFHGELAPGKGLETLIDALPLLKGTRMRVRIVGGGKADYTDSLRQRAISRGVMEMIDWHKHIDNPMVLISTSGFGVILSGGAGDSGEASIEYLAAGKPVVCITAGGESEYVADGNEGFLVPPSNPEALAESMRRLALDSGLRQRMGELAAAAFREKFPWDGFIHQLNGIYS